jgi:RHS repeat-associated protein
LLRFPCQPDFNPSPDNTGCVGRYTESIPFEQCIESYDVTGSGGTPPSPCPNNNPSGKLLRTVIKGWYAGNAYSTQRPTLDSVQTTLDNNQSSLTVNCYNTSQEMTETDEYDLGTSTPTLPTCATGVPSGAVSGPLLRKTTTAYASFTGTNIVDLPSSVITYNGSGTRVAESDSSYDQSSLQTTSVVQHVTAPGGSARGNTTTVTKQCFVGSTACSIGNSVTTYSYYDTGQIYQMTDPCGNGTCSDVSGSNHTTTYSYTDSYTPCSGSAPPNGATNAYLTQVTYPETGTTNHIVSYCHDYVKGLTFSSTDENSQTTTYAYVDSLDRLTQTSYADGGQTTYSYNDTPPSPTITATKKLNSSQSITSVSTMNGLGAVTQTQLTSDPQGTITTLKKLDGQGRDYEVYNPYRSTSDPTYGYTTYVYDALGRTTSVTKQDSSVVTTQYCGQETLVTDEASHWRRSKTDGLGRLIEVDEPNSTTATVNVCPGTGEPIWVTTYTNDALNNLTAVVQGGSRNRSFTFDSLKRMTQSTNPEPGTISYAYDLNGNVSTKTDGRSITSTYSYDDLNRVAGITYSNGDPSVSYTYDQDQSTCLGLGQNNCYNIGHRTTMSDAGGTENLAYDKMGRELVEQRTTNSITKNTTYTYDLAGDLATLTYPSGRTITYTYDSAGRASDAVDTTNSINYAVGSCSNGAASPTTGTCYTPQGAVSQIQNGTNLVSTYLFNVRLQPCWMYATTGTALATSTLCTATDSTPGNILDLKYCFYTWSSGACSSSTTNNGNVIGITNNRDTTRTQNFTYDQVNRIVSAAGSTYSQSSAHCWGETYTYDQWANMSAIGVISSSYNGCLQDSLSVSVTTNNQLSSAGFSYDAAGNMLTDNVNTYAWNAESEMKSGSGVTYTYDGDGNRLMKANQKIYWYGAGTEILDESDTSGNFTNEYVFFGGRRIAIRSVSSGTIDYYEEDMLGSSRTLVQAGGTSPCFDADFLPFGYEKDVTTTCSQNYKFEGKERDTETGDDDFGARYYTFRLGRWLSADWSSVPAPVPYANLTNPQTLNLYAMVSDNPESFADLDGHCGTGAPSEPCHDTHGQGPSSVEGEPGSSGIVNASCSLESCETYADSSAQGTQIAAQETAKQKGPQKYDPSKSGPEDPSNPGHPLAQNPIVEKASDQAFMTTNDGRARSGLAEAGFAIEYKDGKVSIANKVDSVNSDKKPGQLDIKTDANTIAILHTHGNKALPTPSPGDLTSRLPNFVRSQRDLYVTVPNTGKYIQLLPAPKN